MNHNVTIGIVAIVAATALTGVAFAIQQQQQALAGGHHYKYNNHNSNSVKVDQQINQLNQCTGVPQAKWILDNTRSSTVCLNQGDNSADIHR
jgi:hypothetical protein